MLKQSLKFASIAVLALAIGACASKKKTEDQSLDGNGTETSAPQIDSTPMSFDASGSDSGKIDGLQTIYFDYDKSNLTGTAKKILAGNAGWLKSHGKATMQIEGHCDARGSIEYNLSLGERRAQAVKAYMVSLGVAGNRLSVISYGKEKPIVNGDSEDAYAKNRRANFLPLGQ